jgi:hypothetical protein
MEAHNLKWTIEHAINMSQKLIKQAIQTCGQHAPSVMHHDQNKGDTDNQWVTSRCQKLTKEFSTG